MKDLGMRVLESERLILRPFRRRDFSAMYNTWAKDSRVTKYTNWTAHRNRFITLKYLCILIKKYKKPFNYDWAIQLKSTGKLIGSISAVKCDSEWVYEGIAGIKFEVGYCIGHDYWNKGYASEALAMVRDYFFYECGVERIVACHRVDNIYSGKVMRKIGMEFVEYRQTDKLGESHEMQDVAVYKLENVKY